MNKYTSEEQGKQVQDLVRYDLMFQMLEVHWGKATEPKQHLRRNSVQRTINDKRVISKFLTIWIRVESLLF